MRKIIIVSLCLLLTGACKQDIEKKPVESPKVKTSHKKFDQSLTKKLENDIDSLNLSHSYTVTATLFEDSQSRRLNFKFYFSENLKNKDSVQKIVMENSSGQITNLDKFDDFVFKYFKNGKLIETNEVEID
jgi:hypothetical protein